MAWLFSQPGSVVVVAVVAAAVVVLRVCVCVCVLTGAQTSDEVKWAKSLTHGADITWPETEESADDELPVVHERPSCFASVTVNDHRTFQFRYEIYWISFRYRQSSVIFVNENENENGKKRENNEFVNEN